MTISMPEVEALMKYPGTTGRLLESLQIASLDACVGLYPAMRIPLHFDDRHRNFLQQELREYRLPAGAKTGFIKGWGFKVIQSYEVNFGRGQTELLIQWMSHCHSVPTFGDKMQDSIWDIQKGKISGEIPLRVQRFDALRDLLTDADDDALDAVLLPENLSSEWDKHCWASNYYPEEDENTWNPSISVWWYIVGSGTHLAWENACRNPRITTTELDEIYAWVMTNTRSPPADLPRPETMFLPPRLRAEYEERGLIAPEA